MFGAMNEGWKDSSNLLFYPDTMFTQQNNMMGQQFNNAMLQQEKMHKEMEIFNQRQWIQAQERMKIEEHMLNQQFEQIKLQQ